MTGTTPPPPPPPPSPPSQPSSQPASGWKGLPFWLRLAIGIVVFGILAGALLVMLVVVFGVGASVFSATLDDDRLVSQAESDTRNAAIEIETAATGNGGRYPEDLAAVIQESGPWSADIAVGSSSDEEFCIESSHPDLPDRGVIVHYDSDGGGIGDGPC